MRRQTRIVATANVDGELITASLVVATTALEEADGREWFDICQIIGAGLARKAAAVRTGDLRRIGPEMTAYGIIDEPEIHWEAWPVGPPLELVAVRGARL